MSKNNYIKTPNINRPNNKQNSEDIIKNKSSEILFKNKPYSSEKIIKSEDCKANLDKARISYEKEKKFVMENKINCKKEENTSSCLKIKKVHNEINNRRIFDSHKMSKITNNVITDQDEILYSNPNLDNLSENKFPDNKFSQVEDNKDNSNLNKNDMHTEENLVNRSQKSVNNIDLHDSSFSNKNLLVIKNFEVFKNDQKANKDPEKNNNLNKFQNKNISQNNNHVLKESIKKSKDIGTQSPYYINNSNEHKENKIPSVEIRIVNNNYSDNLFSEINVAENNFIKLIDKNHCCEIDDTEANVVNVLESRKNKNNFDILKDKFDDDRTDKKYSNNFKNYNNNSYKFIKTYKDREKKLSKENSISNANSLRKESISPSRKDQEKKLIFVKSNESIKLNKLNELSFANDSNNFYFSNKNTNKEQNSILSNRSSRNNKNMHRKSLESINNVNHNEEELNIYRGCNNEFNGESDVFRMLNNKNKNFRDSELRNSFKTGDDSEYKIELETSKILSELKINNFKHDAFPDPELTKTEEDHKFPFNINKDKLSQEQRFNKKDKIEDIQIENQNHTDKENIFSSYNNSEKSGNKSDNNFSKFNNINNFSNIIHDNIPISKSNLNNKVNTHLNNNFQNMSYKTSNNFYTHNHNKEYYQENLPSSYKVEEISNIMKRVLEKNKREAAAKSREFLNNYPQNYFNLGKTQTLFFMGPFHNSKSERPSTDHSKTRPHFDTINFLEINLYDQAAWRKHEEVWDLLKNNNKTENKNETENLNEKNKESNKNNIFKNKNNNVLINLSFNPNNLSKNPLIDKENLLFPPNDDEVLTSAYYNAYKITGKLIIDDNIQQPKEEINKWKNAYKKTVMRWHPDKLIPFIESLQIKDEDKKDSIIKKAGVIIYQMNKNLKNIVEILKNISIKKEKMNLANN